MNELEPAKSTFVAPTNAKECVEQATVLINKMMDSMLKYADAKYLARLQSVALSALAANPKLMSALSTPRGQSSFQVSVRQAAEMNLLCDGIQASIVPYKGICKLVIMYQGMIETAYRSKLVRAFRHGKVCTNDMFSWINGEINHAIDFKNPDRGETVGYWVRAIAPDGLPIDNFMTKGDVDRIRSSSAGRDEAPWTYHYDEMAYKTVLRNLYKWLPKTEAMDKAAAISDAEYELPQVPPGPRGKDPFLAAPEAPKQIESGLAVDETFTLGEDK